MTVCNFVKNAFINPGMIEEVNKTLLVLIPKVECPKVIKQFRPISLCNVIYKVVTKIVALRLRVCMPHWIAPNQCSFVPGRHSTDNIIITQEVIHSMRYKKGRQGWMAIKVDLEKAYDRVDWCFLENTLQHIGIGEKLLPLIMKCVTSTSLNVLWNGEKT